MKVTINMPTEIDLRGMRVVAGVRHWENAVVNGIEDVDGSLIPCRNGDNWEPVINIETGEITNWKQGTTAEVHYKVCDCCSWSFIDSEGGDRMEVTNEYVPSCLSPKDNGYGDYIIMDIDADGKIKDWKFDITDFVTEED